MGEETVTQPFRGEVLWTKFMSEYTYGQEYDVQDLQACADDGALNFSELGYLTKNAVLDQDVFEENWAGRDGELTIKDIVVRLVENNKLSVIAVTPERFQTALLAMGTEAEKIDDYLKLRGGEVPERLSYASFGDLFGVDPWRNSKMDFARSFVLDETAWIENDAEFASLNIESAKLVAAVYYAADLE